MVSREVLIGPYGPDCIDANTSVIAKYNHAKDTAKALIFDWLRFNNQLRGGTTVASKGMCPKNIVQGCYIHI